MLTFQETVLSNVAWAGALALLAAVVGRLFRRRPTFSHGLWLLVLLKLVTPSFVFLSTAPTRPKPTVFQTAKPPEIVKVAPKPALIDPPVTTEVPGPIVSPTTPRITAQPTAIAREPWPWRTIVGVLWMVGAAAWFVRMIWQAFRFRRLLRAAEPADEALVARVEDLAKRVDLRKPPTVWMVPARVPPMLWALVGPPRLLLPETLWKSLGDSERETILVHELAHLKRRDHWVRRLEVIVLGLYWWNPIAWWARREVEKAEEACCDAWVVWALPEALEAYAEALVATAVFLSGREVYRPLGASGAGTILPLHERLNMLPRDVSKNMPARPASRRVLMMGLLGLLILPTWGSAQTLAITQDKPAEVLVPAKPKEPAAAPPEKAAIPVVEAMDSVLVSQPIVDDVSDYVDLTGTIEAAKTVEIRARVTGTLDKIHSYEGMIIDKGTPLFEIDARTYEAEMDRANAEVRGKEAKLKRAMLEFAQAKKLADKQGISQAELAIHETEVAEAESALSAAKSTRDLAQIKLDSAKITAPIRGKLSRVQLAEGSLVVADTTILATISTTDPMMISFALPQFTVLKLAREKHEGRSKFALEPGLPILIRMTDEIGFPHRGVISSVDTRVSPGSGTIRCLAELPNPEGYLIPGLSVGVRIFTSAPAKALLVNQSALLTKHNPWRVCVVNDQNRVEERELKVVGSYFGDLLVVREGLKETDWVVAELAEGIQSEATIKPRKGPMPTNDKGPRSIKAGEANKSDVR